MGSEMVSQRIRHMRDRYSSNPARTIASIAEEQGVSWEIAYRVLAGIARPGSRDIDLIQYRIKNVVELQMSPRNLQRRVHPEHGAAARYSRIVDKAYRARRRAEKPEKPKRERYVSMIGSSIRAAAIQREAARRAAD